MKELSIVTRNARHCRILIGNGALNALANIWKPVWEEAVVIGDSTVLGLLEQKMTGLLGPLVARFRMLGFHPGEPNKSRRTKEHLEDQILEDGYGRGTCIVAAGGGISLDVAGLVAATFMRGIPYVNIPTTLLAQVDASIGGKTAVNTRHGKNLVGAFHQPEAILIDPDLLTTLPVQEWRNGLAEVVKHAVIADANLFEWLESHADELVRPSALPPALLRSCVDIKAKVVDEDERENGKRAILNFGHTVGHAIESATSYEASHGMAVAEGMLVEGAIAGRRTGFPDEHLQRLSALLSDLGLIGNHGHARPSFEQIRPYIERDKKRANQKIRMSLPASLGTMEADGGAYTLQVETADIRKAWNEHLRQPG